ncbi:hypothetical protein ATO49_00415 [Mycolicibacterium fortuitum subsp. fortuitum DSM 46621 = ATCC 6841 = JCM 6387]|nr:hypothetical protein ATO49_00415 [Mycolicibacterium fortuitum subsp. fortuitum DSM 46621 = ATCC 6841 = JCM 6387]
MMSPGRRLVAATLSYPVAPPGSSTTRRAGGSWTASNRLNNRSARTCWVAANRALPVSTDPTRIASIGEPSIALAAEPTASTGVSGSDSSERNAVASSVSGRGTTCCHCRAGPCPRRESSSTARASAIRLRTCSGVIACQSSTGTALGAASSRAPRASQKPFTSPAAAPAVTGPGPRPRTPGTISSAPSSVPPVASLHATLAGPSRGGDRVHQPPHRREVDGQHIGLPRDASGTEQADRQVGNTQRAGRVP